MVEKFDGSGHDGSGHWIAETIHDRAGTGPSDRVAGWQGLLADLLEKTGPQLSAGRRVTFRALLPEEKTFFEALGAGPVIRKRAEQPPFSPWQVKRQGPPGRSSLQGTGLQP